jgi:hypothetical protein
LTEGTRLGLQRAIEFLAASPDPTDRNDVAELRAKTTVINTLINVQLKVDETRLREKQRDDGIAEISGG